MRTYLDERPTADDARDALNIALLLQRSEAHIALLAERVQLLDYGEESALFYALGNRKYVQYLLSRKADINCPNPFGKTVLFYAIEMNDRRLVRLLLANGANVNHAQAGQAFKQDFTRQDAAILNVMRAYESAADLANMSIREKRLGLPSEMKESFALLERSGLIPADLSGACKR